MNRRPAFMLMELMVTVAIASILATSAIPRIRTAIAKSKTAQCDANRQEIQSAEMRYRIEHNNTPAASIEELKDSKYIDRSPYCTAGGTYVWVSTSAAIVGCSVHYWPFSNPSGPTPLFSSDFSSMSMLKVLSGKWVTAGGILQSLASMESRLSFGDDTWTDYSISLNANLTTGSGYGVYYRADGKSAISGYCFQYDPGWGSGGAFLVRKVVNGTESSPIAVTKIPAGFPIYNTQHQIQITVSGSAQTIYVDGVKMLTLTDSTFTSGSAGLRTWDSTRAEFDSVTVLPG